MSANIKYKEWIRNLPGYVLAQINVKDEITFIVNNTPAEEQDLVCEKWLAEKRRSLRIDEIPVNTQSAIESTNKRVRAVLQANLLIDVCSNCICLPIDDYEFIHLSSHGTDTVMKSVSTNAENSFAISSTLSDIYNTVGGLYFKTTTGISGYYEIKESGEIKGQKVFTRACICGGLCYINETPLGSVIEKTNIFGE